MRAKTMSQRMLIFFTCLMMVAEIRAQCERPSVNGNRILTPESDTLNFPEGSTAKFKCSVGYEPVDRIASKVITCSGQQWTDLQLECQKKSCGALPDIPYGRYLYQEGITFGARVTAECNVGYNLIGEHTRNCRDAGWDGRAPTCEVVKCSKPPEINYGYLEETFKDEYRFAEAVTYSCNNGFIPSGSLTISCSADGTFQPSPPRCLNVRCNEPHIEDGIRIEGKSPPYGYKHYVRYMCRNGYSMEGNDYLTCEVEGWDPPPPKCIKYFSSTLPSPSSGTTATISGGYSSPRPTTTPPPSSFGLKLGFGIGILIVLVAVAVAFLIKMIVCRNNRSVKVPTRNEDVEY